MIKKFNTFCISRRFVFILFTIAVVYTVLLQHFGVVDLCTDQDSVIHVHCSNVLATSRDYTFLTAILLSPFFVTLLFRYKVFLGWAKLALVTIPITLILTAYILSMPGSGWMPSGAGAFFLLILYGTYLILSLLVIGIAWWRSRGN